MKIAIALEAWSHGRGEVATEWRFRIAPPGESSRPLVPDVAFVFIDRLRGLSHEAIQAPAFAPTVAVEVLSPGDDPRDIADKVGVYLRGGSLLAIVVDPENRTMSVHDSAGTRELGANEVLRHEALPGFELPLGPLFSGALDLPV
jgi:Uma2 family endonuclease